MEQMITEIETTISTDDILDATENSSEVIHRSTTQFNMIAFDQQ